MIIRTDLKDFLFPWAAIFNSRLRRLNINDIAHLWMLNSFICRVCNLYLPQIQTVYAANTDCICHKYRLYMPQIQKRRKMDFSLVVSAYLCNFAAQYRLMR